MKDAADLAKNEGRKSIAAAGFSRKWQNALRSKVFPTNGNSISPAALIYHKIPYADAFEEGAVIRGKPYLWLPLPNLPVRSRGVKMTPKKFRDTIGPLYSIKSPGKPPMLGAVVRLTSRRAGKGLSMAALKRGRNPGGRGTVRIVPVFVGVRSVNITKRFHIKDAVRRAAALLGVFYLRNLKSD